MYNKDDETGMPLVTALRNKAAAGTARFHMPGHKGRELPFGITGELVSLDYTEAEDTGNLYDRKGPISDAEHECAKLYSAGSCIFLTGGASQGICAAIAASCAGGRELLCDRSVHKSVLDACALMDIKVNFVLPRTVDAFGIPGDPDVQSCLKILKKRRTGAVVITTPNYYGYIPDTSELSALCREYGVKIIADRAHGAHFPAIRSMKSFSAGADYTIVSMHKTTRAMGQTALLLVKDENEDEMLRRCAAMAGTSSPSYALMASADAARRELEENAQIWENLERRVNAIRRTINGRGVFSALCGERTDPCRLTVNTGCGGLGGKKADEILRRKFSVECEMADSVNAVFIITSADSKEDIDILTYALYRLEEYAGKSPIYPNPILHLPERAATLRNAAFSPCEKIPLCRAQGYVSAQMITVYPPGIAVFAPGERIDKCGIEILINNGYNIDAAIDVIPDSRI